jgi:benzoyl-CoA 2,3-dioxygenase component B
MRNALNEVLRDWYVEDCRSGIDRWNRRIASHGIDFQFTLPDRRFNRHIGVFAGLAFDPSGGSMTQEEWQRRQHDWLPSPADTEYLKSLQATPQPIDFEYVRTET